MHPRFDLPHPWYLIAREDARSGDKWLDEHFAEGTPGFPGAWVPYVENLDGKLKQGTFVIRKGRH